MSNIITINYSNDTINDICCICMDDENLSTIKCSQCVNKFHLNCICEWSTTAAVNKKYLLFNLIEFTKVSCPCCRIYIRNNRITMHILYNVISKYKYKIVGLIIITSIFTYLLCEFIYNNPLEAFVIFYHIFGMFLTWMFELLCKKYNIEFNHPYHEFFD